MRVRTAIGACLASFWALSMAAGDKSQVLSVPLNLKVGLWQMTYTTERNGVAVVHPIAPGLLARMTPEQRAKTGARLKARAAQGTQVETRQYCMTDERLKNTNFELSEMGQVCPRTVLTSTPALQQFREECAANANKRTVDGYFEAVDPDTIKGSLKVKSEGSNAYTMSVEIGGRWIAADCGKEAQ